MTPERFWARVDRSGGPDACWPWMGERNRDGYGVVRAHRRNLRAHRVARLLSTGSLVPELDICHHCDNPPCCNPAHLFEGTARDNMLDASKKGRLSRDPARLARGAQHGRATCPEATARGERVGTARFSASDILTMRGMYAAGWSQHEIARAFGTYQGSVGRIVRGEAWRHLLPTEAGDCADGIDAPGHGAAVGQ